MQIRKNKPEIVIADRKKMVNNYAKRLKSGNINTKIFKDNRYKKKKKSKRKKVGWKVEKQSM